MKLKKVKSVELKPRIPFNFDATFHKPAHFPSGDNYWQPGIRWQTWFWRGKQLGLKFKNLGKVNNPKIRINIYYQNEASPSTPACRTGREAGGFFLRGSATPPTAERRRFLWNAPCCRCNKLSKQYVDSLIEEIRYRYNLDLDLTDFYEKFKNDKILGPVIKRLQGMRPGHQNSLYEYLIIGIVLQNATVKRSIYMLQVLFENYGKLLEYDGKKLWCFWKPGGLQKVTEKELRALKLGYRAKSIKRIDGYFAQGLIDEFKLRQKNSETQKKELIKLYGVGPATAWYLLFDVFHHYDFFDHISPWEQKIYSKLFFNKDPEKLVPVKKLLQYFEKYGRYKQLAVHYIWEDLWWRRKNKRIPWLEKLIKI